MTRVLPNVAELKQRYDKMMQTYEKYEKEIARIAKILTALGVLL